MAHSPYIKKKVAQEVQLRAIREVETHSLQTLLSKSTGQLKKLKDNK